MIKFTEDYAFAHDGYRIERFKAGQIVEKPSKELTETALQDGAAVDREAEKPTSKKSKA